MAGVRSRNAGLQFENYGYTNVSHFTGIDVNTNITQDIELLAQIFISAQHISANSLRIRGAKIGEKGMGYV